MARRFGSAMIPNADSILLIYPTKHIRVKAYKGRARQRFQSARGMHRLLAGGHNWGAIPSWCDRPSRFESKLIRILFAARVPLGQCQSRFDLPTRTRECVRKAGIEKSRAGQRQ
jgi:hypothetical protein